MGINRQGTTHMNYLDPGPFMNYIIFGFLNKSYNSIDFVKVQGRINEFSRISMNYSSHAKS